MGGWMTYERMRNRNGLMYRKPDDDPDPYWRGDPPPDKRGMALRSPILIGDMNRMERDYLNPAYPDPEVQARRPDRSDPATVIADDLGVDVELVRAVVRRVFAA